MKISSKWFSGALVMLLSLSYFSTALAKSDVDWRNSDETSQSVIDHSAWQGILDQYLNVSKDGGVNLFAYGDVEELDQAKLQAYLKNMQKINPEMFNKQEQKAYWINLYNALTVKLILDNYPVKSITKLGESIFSFGPWDDDMAKVNEVELSLNDIEHEILRPIFKDPLIHYAVNCASYSCPNLAGKAFTSQNMNDLLDNGAREYVNHVRGVKIDGEDLLVSSIYHWYKGDFGGEDASLLAHLKNYANPKLKAKISAFENGNGDIEHSYNWDLNEAK
jgi:hypothetical protein